MGKQQDLLASLFKKLGADIIKVNKMLFAVFTGIDLVYYILYLLGVVRVGMPLLEYTLINVLRPLTYNILVMSIGYWWLNKKTGFGGAGALFVTNLLFGVRMLVHSDMTSLFPLLSTPLFLGILYANRQLVKRLFFQGLCIYGVNFFLINISVFSVKNAGFYPSFFTSLVSLICCYMCVNMLIEYEEDKQEIVYRYKRDYESIRNDACLDGLTKVYNFKALNEVATDWVENKKNVVFCLIDIDDFKKVNDTYGHEFGNVVLKRLGVLLNYRSSDNIMVARYGGEEFAILAYGMDAKGMFTLVDKLRKNFRLEEYRETDDAISFSGGIGIFVNGMSVSELFASADRKLYEAKKNGKNQVLY